jgi:Lrp/AsnC family transcriptional regulator
MALTALAKKMIVSAARNARTKYHEAALLDDMDVKILKILQQDCTRPVADIGKEVGLSTTPCWRRIQKLEESGVIKRRVAVLDAAKVNAAVTVFVSIKTDHHGSEWLKKFHTAVDDFPEVVEFYRMSGEVDYLLRVVVPDIGAYDRFYKKLINRIEVAKVSSAFAMEQIKYTTAMPLDFAQAHPVE